MEAELPNPHEIEEHKANPFTQRVALCTAATAVFLAVAGLLGRNAAEEAAMLQMQSSNQWAFYQAKSTKQNIAVKAAELYDSELDLLGPLGKLPGVGSLDDVVKKAAGKRDKAAADAKRYDDEQKEIKAKAEALEAERNVYVNRGPHYERGEVLLQIAIVLASVSMLASSRMAFIVALTAAAIGIGSAGLGFASHDDKQHEDHGKPHAAAPAAHK